MTYGYISTVPAVVRLSTLDLVPPSAARSAASVAAYGFNVVERDVIGRSGDVIMVADAAAPSEVAVVVLVIIRQPVDLRRQGTGR